MKKINKIDIHLIKLTKTKLINLRQSGDITTDPNEIKNIIGTYLKNLYSVKLKNLKEISEFLDAYYILK